MDMDKLVEAVTRMILERLNTNEAPKVVTFGDIPRELICGDAQTRPGQSRADIDDCDYIVMSAESFRQLHGSSTSAQVLASARAVESALEPRTAIDLTEKRLIHERDLRDHNTRNGDVIKVSRNAIITALAHDYAKGIGARIVRDCE